MSKIQEALKKIQAARTVGLPLRSRTEEVVEQVASLVPQMQVKTSEQSDPEATVTLPERIVQFDDQALRDAGLLAPADDQDMLDGDYRNIKRPLVAHALGKRATKIPDGHLIMVTSAMPGEGKTFSCINLSLSISQEKDTTVLLVDADLAKPHITSLFGLQDEYGLLDVLDETVPDLESVIFDTSIAGLKILPAGRPREHATELLASQRMEKIVTELGAGGVNRIVLFDSPPLLLTSEAKVLASLVGQIAVVVKAGDTPQQAVIEAISMLPEGKAANLILNQVRQSGYGGYYGSGSKYGYGQPYGSNKE